MRDLELRWETWDQFWHNDVQTLAREEYNEAKEALALWKPHNISTGLLSMAGNSGFMFFAAARFRGIAVGYATMTIEPDGESEGYSIAKQGALYVAKSFAKKNIGAKLLGMVINKAKELGASEVEFHHPVSGRGRSVGKFVTALGARPINQTYLLRL